MTRLCNFIEAVYLPWKSHRPVFRPYQEVLAELAAFNGDNNPDSLHVKNTFINRHVLRTIRFALSNKSVNSETKKMIQLVRHQYSRKRDSCLPVDAKGEKPEDGSEETDLLEIIRDNQLDQLCLSKPKSAADEHIDELCLKCDNLMAASSKQIVRSVVSKSVLS